MSLSFVSGRFKYEWQAWLGHFPRGLVALFMCVAIWNTWNILLWKGLDFSERMRNIVATWHMLRRTGAPCFHSNTIQSVIFVWRPHSFPYRARWCMLAKLVCGHYCVSDQTKKAVSTALGLVVIIELARWIWPSSRWGCILLPICSLLPSQADIPHLTIIDLHLPPWIQCRWDDRCPTILRYVHDLAAFTFNSVQLATLVTLSY